MTIDTLRFGRYRIAEWDYNNPCDSTGKDAKGLVERVGQNSIGWDGIG